MLPHICCPLVPAQGRPACVILGTSHQPLAGSLPGTPQPPPPASSLGSWTPVQLQVQLPQWPRPPSRLRVSQCFPQSRDQEAPPPTDALASAPTPRPWALHCPIWSFPTLGTSVGGVPPQENPQRPAASLSARPPQVPVSSPPGPNACAHASCPTLGPDHPGIQHGHLGFLQLHCHPHVLSL